MKQNIFREENVFKINADVNLMCILLLSDLYEGTRMAKVADFSAIRQIIQPLEESDTLVKRTDEEVCTCAPFWYFILFKLFFESGLIISCGMS